MQKTGSHMYSRSPAKSALDAEYQDVGLGIVSKNLQPIVNLD